MDKKDLTLKAWRIESGLTRVEVAALIGKTEKTIQNWELGLSIPDKGNLYRLAEIYHTKIDSIFLGDKSALSDRYSEFKLSQK